MIIASKDNPRTLRNKHGEEVRCTDQAEYLASTTTRGYRDVTDESGQAKAKDKPKGGGAGSQSSSDSGSASST